MLSLTTEVESTNIGALLQKTFKIMPRAVNSVATRAKRKRVLKQAKGFFGRRKNVWTVAKNAVEKAMCYAYRDRKQKKRNFRALWIMRINAGARQYGMSYSQFMGKVKANNIELNRKVLADLAMNHSEAFAAIVNKVK
jgi:large subunit ribosomal protein L20